MTIETIDPGQEQLMAAVEAVVATAETATTKEAFRTAVSATILGAFEFGRQMGLQARSEIANPLPGNRDRVPLEKFDKFTQHMLMAAVQRLAVAQRGPNKQTVIFPLAELYGIENFALSVEPDAGRKQFRLNIVRK